MIRESWCSSIFFLGNVSPEFKAPNVYLHFISNLINICLIPFSDCLITLSNKQKVVKRWNFTWWLPVCCSQQFGLKTIWNVRGFMRVQSGCKYSSKYIVYLKKNPYSFYSLSLMHFCTVYPVAMKFWCVVVDMPGKIYSDGWEVWKMLGVVPGVAAEG